MDIIDIILAKKLAESSGGGSTSGGGTNNYNQLINLPRINDVQLIGNLSLADLNLQAANDETLNTTSKTIVGAINELLEKLNSIMPSENEVLLTIPKSEEVDN